MASVSWSEMASWSRCRKLWDWQYRRHIEPVNTAEAILYGNCGHVALVSALRGQDHALPIRQWMDRERANASAPSDVLDNIGQVINIVIDRYRSHYDDSNWKLVEVELPFKLPTGVAGYDISGVIDAIVQDEQDRFWLLEHKFPKSFRNEEYIALDGQVPIYQWAANQLGFPVVGTVYNQIAPVVPKIPELIKSGAVSRMKIRTDWVTYKAFVRAHGMDPGDYLDMMEKLAENEFFRRYYVFRNDTEMSNFAEDLRVRLVDMTREDPLIYHNLNGGICSMCPYSELCIEGLKGGDVETLIDLSFKPRRRPDDERNVIPAHADIREGVA